MSLSLASHMSCQGAVSFLAVASRRDGRSFRFGGKGAGPGRRELGGSQTFKLGSKVNEHVDTVTFVYLCRNLYGI